MFRHDRLPCPLAVARPSNATILARAHWPVNAGGGAGARLGGVGPGRGSGRSAGRARLRVRGLRENFVQRRLGDWNAPPLSNLPVANVVDVRLIPRKLPSLTAPRGSHA